MKEKYAVVAVGYDRPLCLERLLRSLQAGEYDGDEVDLVISIDYSGEDHTQKVAEQCKWEFGNKIVRIFETRQGLRNHILLCGDLTEKYSAIAVFEDDIVVSPGYYLYMKQVVKYYENDPAIAGISLYSRQWNIITDRMFEPQNMGADVYFFQLAQSWGQIWTKNQWREFREWYVLNEKKEIPNNIIPECIKNWPHNSWLKFYIWYCVEKNKYFVYPYVSLTTNFMEKGEHNQRNNFSRYQVVMQMGVVRNYNLIPLTKDAVRYDVFFENENVAAWLNLSEEELCVDLYGSKESVGDCKYWLTSRQEDLPVLRGFGLEMRPLEENIRTEVEGEYFRLYQLPQGYEIKSPKPRRKELKMLDYDIRGEGIRPRNVFLWCLGCILKGMHLSF